MEVGEIFSDNWDKKSAYQSHLAICCLMVVKPPDKRIISPAFFSGRREVMVHGLVSQSNDPFPTKFLHGLAWPHMLK